MLCPLPHTELSTEKFKQELAPLTYMPTFKEQFGAYLIDLLPLTLNLSSRQGWVKVCNRNNNISVNKNPLRVRINERWTSDLAINRTLPWTGKWLMHKSLQDWPVSLSSSPVFSHNPAVSFVIPFRGQARLELLLTVIKSIATSKNIEVECLIIEQSQESVITNLPATVRHIHAPSPVGNPAWNKAFAFNTGVGLAKSDIVICHDADILVPENFAYEIYQRLTNEQLEVIYPQRFLYYLSEIVTSQLINSQSIKPVIPESIKQNWVGGTLAITKQAYVKIGGFNEYFENWGMEDNDFYDRTQTLNGDFFGYLPFIHLWHIPQSQKIEPAIKNSLHNKYKTYFEQTPADRIPSIKSQLHENHPWVRELLN
jgi:hypothetical protein